MSGRQSQKNFIKQNLRQDQKNNNNNDDSIDDLFIDDDSSKQSKKTLTVNRQRKQKIVGDDDSNEGFQQSPVKKVKIEQDNRDKQVSVRPNWLLKISQTLTKSIQQTEKTQQQSLPALRDVQENKQCDQEFISMIRNITSGQMICTKMYLQAFESSTDPKHIDGFAPFDILKESNKQCDAIQIQIMIGKDDDNQFPLCFSHGQGSKYRYARIRFCRDGSLHFFNPKTWKYFKSSSVDKFDCRDIMLRLFETFDEQNLTIDDLSEVQKWEQAVMILEVLKESRLSSESKPFELFH